MYVLGCVCCDLGNIYIWIGMILWILWKGLNIVCCIVKISIWKNERIR